MKHWIRKLLLPLLLTALLAGCALPGGNARALAQALDQAVTQTQPTDPAQSDAPAREETAPPATEEPAPEETTAPKRIIGGRQTFSQMAYQRPELALLEQQRLDALAAAQAGEVEAALDALDVYFDGYEWYYTYYSIADIRYSAALSDAYWEEEYNFYLETYAQVDEGLEALYYDLAATDCVAELEEEYFGEGYFDDYQGENLWGPEYTALLERESVLTGEYYTLSEEPNMLDSADQLAQLLVELVRVRQEIAEYWGYDSYPEFANEHYYYRDYDLAQMQRYLKEISRELVPLYRSVAYTDAWNAYFDACSEEQMLAYLRETAENMGGTPRKAFQEMVERELCDLTYSDDKFQISFEVYLTGYEVPYVFLNPNGYAYDKLTLSHEFGHFCNDYASHGNYAGVDVLEVFSQAMEYLSLRYGPASPELTRMKLADSLSVYVEQAMFASFELQLYSLTGEDLSVEGLYKLYQKLGKEFGFGVYGFDRRDFVTIPHFYTNPMYVFSYVVSNDAAMQLYLLELETEGAGLACFEENLDTEEAYFLAFLETAGLRSPFEANSLQSVRELLEKQIRS